MSTRTTSISVGTTIETDPAVISNYYTTYLVVSPGTSTSTWTTVQLVYTTIPASIHTVILSVPLVTIVPASLLSSSSTLENFTKTASSDSSSSILITSTKNFPSISTNPTNSSSTPINAVHPSPSGVDRNSSNVKTAEIVAGILGPLGLIILACGVCIIRKRRHRRSRDKLKGLVSRGLSERSNSNLQLSSIPSPPRPPHKLPNGDPESFRVASPHRPQRPKSIAESVLNIMSQRVGTPSKFGETLSERSSTPPELAKVGIPKTIFNAEVDAVMRDGYDGTRNKCPKTVLERGMPMEQLTGPSLRTGNPPRRKGTSSTDLPHSTHSPEPLRIHKKSSPESNGISTGIRYVTNLEETAHLNLAPTEKEFFTMANRGNSTTPPLQSAFTEELELMADASSIGSRLAKLDEIAQKRQEALAALEGLTAEVVGSDWCGRSSRGQERDKFGRPRPSCFRVPTSEESLATKDQASLATEDASDGWFLKKIL